jgi:hypothetical protein
MGTAPAWIMVLSPPQPLRQIEEQEFCRVGRTELEHGLFAQGGPVASRDRSWRTRCQA